MTIKQPARIIFLCVFLISFIVYLITLSPFPSGYADADEITVAAYLWSVAHPPGYPLLISFLGLLMRLFRFFEPSAVANIFSAASMSAAMGFMAVALSKTLTLLPTITPLKSKISVQKSQYIQIFICATATLLIAFSTLLWLFSGRAEIFSFALLINSISIYYAFSLFTASTPAEMKRFFNLMILFNALAVSHLQTSILLLPGLVTLVLVSLTKFKQAKLLTLKNGLLSFFIWVVGFILPNLLLFPLNQHRQDFSWYFEPSVSGWFNHIIRRDYSGVFIEESVSRSAYFFIPKITSLNNLNPYFAIVISHIGITAFILFIIGLFISFIHHKKLGMVNLLLYIFPGLIFSILLGNLNLKIEPFSKYLEIAVTQKQHLLGFMLMIPSIGYGLWWIVHTLSKRTRSWRFLNTSTLILSVSLIMSSIVLNFKVGFQRPNRLVYDYARDILRTAEPNALILCTMDIPCFSLQYARLVDSLRSDVTVITKNSLYHRYLFQKNPGLYEAATYSNPGFVQNLVSLNIRKKPVYLTEPDTYYVKALGLNADPFYLNPESYLFKIELEAPSALSSSNQDHFTEKLIASAPDSRDYYQLGLKTYFSALHTVMQEITNNYGESYLTQKHRNVSAALSPNDPQTQAQLSKPLNQQPVANYEPQSRLSDQDLFSQMLKSYQQEDYQLAYELNRKLVLIEPTNLQYRAFLIYLLVQGGFESEAEIESQNFRLIFPNITNIPKFVETTIKPYLN